ncbi:MAG: ABC transporter permease [Candidatus Korarchaeum sp.]|nr:ABC transporter permease [Candidatus Korarchaeum sp.]MDW8036080.1 ABC transporter permease [Candidatus Korarchaeum sp.]
MIEDLLNLLSQMLTAAIPILLTSVGEIVTERSGVVNIGLEGILVLSAFISSLVTFSTGNPYIGLLSGVLVGLIAGSLHAAISVHLKGDQIIAGVGFNTLAYGISILGLINAWGHHGASPMVSKIPFIWAQVYLSPVLPMALALALACWYWLFRTPSGLRLRACGEDPRSAEAMGVNVVRMRFLATVLGAILTGLGGAYIVVGWIGQFTRHISAGRGFIALAIVALSGWNPLLAIAGSLTFGFFDAISLYLPVKMQLMNPNLNLTSLSYVFRTIPYVAVLLAVSFLFKRGRAPRELGRAYIKE